jgi:hypothetical protein
MRVRRNIASIPLRSAKETWDAIIELVSDSESKDRQQLYAAASVMESIITDQLPANVPIVFKGGGGPRVLIYCLFHEDAMEAGLTIDKLSTNPTKGDWSATAPSEKDDVEWMNKTLTTRASRISVHDVDKPADDDKDDDQVQNAVKGFTVDWEVLGKL